MTMVANTQTIGLGALPLPRATQLAYAPSMDTAPEDSALMLRYRDGDVAAFEALYRPKRNPLYRYL